MTIKLGWIDKQTWGNVCFETGEITINWELFVADVFIHEKTHLQHPDWSERRVLKETERVLTRLTVKQIRRLAQRVARKGVK